MIDVKQAVTSASQFLQDIYEGKKIDNVLLEEIELSEDENFWNVTLSFLRPKPLMDASDLFASDRFERVYKKLKIRRDKGTVLSMNRAD